MVAPVDPKILLMDGPFGAIDAHAKTSLHVPAT
jgi:ABC-type nitrate/sulfonate/bicarbonate transport system ATPase subunit